MSKILLSTIAGLLLSVQAFAGLDPAPFARRFDLIRDAQGSVKMIALKKGDTMFSIKPIIEDIRRDLEFTQMAQAAMGQDFEVMMNAAGSGNDWQDNWTPEQKEKAQNSYAALAQINIAAVFENPKFKEVMVRFEAKIKDHLMGHKVMANLQDPKYFYSRAVAHKLANFGFDLAKKYLDTIPLLNIATAVINEVISNVQDRRVFHQNMLLFYFERFEPAQLGMTKDEVLFAKSSIYESKIPWFLFPESNKAKATWKYYGSDYFGFYQMQSDNTLEANKKRYSEIIERVCFSFVTVVEKDQKKIVNLVDRKFIFAPMPADAYIFSAPQKIERLRRLYRLVQLGSQFIPMPSLVRSGFNMFVNSLYQNQERTEGALFGYLEASGQSEMGRTILNQSLNPYLRADFERRGAPAHEDVWLSIL
ncbi:MAG: hypothetical protein ABL958_06190 [Bdellovibrionia bacterium]